VVEGGILKSLLRGIKRRVKTEERDLGPRSTPGAVSCRGRDVVGGGLRGVVKSGRETKVAGNTWAGQWIRKLRWDRGDELVRS